jgi:cysteine desulfurase
MSVAYLDNNATTLMPDEVVREMTHWVNAGNPSSSYQSAKRCQDMMSEFRAFIAQQLGISLDQYAIIFTSGATEANNMICRGIIEQARETGREFYVVTSAIEHKSILLLLHDMQRRIPAMHLIEVRPEIGGRVSAETILSIVRECHPILVTCMFANNETGAINDVAQIGTAIKQQYRSAFFHCDIVQGFGKVPINLRGAKIDGASISFHKLHGPAGVGAAIISRDFTHGFPPLLYGTQSDGMRGGTENIIGIGTAFAASRLVFAHLRETISHELALKSRVISRFREQGIPVRHLAEYIANGPQAQVEIVVIADELPRANVSRYLPGTLMISAAKHNGPAACNTLIKSVLEKARVIVSIGSACNTASKERSHVLTAMGANNIIMDGSIRASFSMFTTADEIDRFVAGFMTEFRRQYTITENARK